MFFRKAPEKFRSSHPWLEASAGGSGGSGPRARRRPVTGRTPALAPGARGPDGEQPVPPGRGTTVWRPPAPERLEAGTTGPECSFSGVRVPLWLPGPTSAAGRSGRARHKGRGRERRCPSAPGAGRHGERLGVRGLKTPPGDPAPGSPAGAGDSAGRTAGKRSP